MRKKCRFHKMNKFNLYNVPKDVVETSTHKQFKSMKKYVKKFSKQKGKYLTLQLKEHLKYKISKLHLQLILLHNNKQNRKNLRNKQRSPNGSYKVRRLELDLNKVGDSNYLKKKKQLQILRVEWLSALFVVGNSILMLPKGIYLYVKQNQSRCQKILEVTHVKNDFYLPCTETQWTKYQNTCDRWVSAMNMHAFFFY